MIPISTIFIGLNGLIALILSCIVAIARTRTRIWHGESEDDVIMQPDPLTQPNVVAATVEKLAVKFLPEKVEDYAVLQRKVRAYGNFAEYVPLGLLIVLSLELMHSPNWLIWLEGSVLTVARIAHAWGLMKTYGPSPGRAIGFYLTWFVYIIGSLACVYYGVRGVI